jgi:ribose 5-phosphate isomerase B
MTNRDNKIIALASDHAGYPLKETLIKYLNSRGIDTIDCGTNSTESCDYPDFAVSGCCKVLDGEADLTILCCGTGIGMSMAANKHRGIRAACCSDTFSARLTRLHNNANVLCLGARVLGAGLALDLVNEFVDAEFEGDRHVKRLSLIEDIENGKTL